MIDLKKDLLARFVISANKDKKLNKPFRVSHVDFENISRSPSPLSRIQNAHVTSDSEGLDHRLSDVSIDAHRDKTKTESIIQKAPVKEKIDEKVEKIVNDPALLEIQLELEFAEKLLTKIKETDKHNPKIPIIEQGVVKLRALLEQKMYV